VLLFYIYGYQCHKLCIGLIVNEEFNTSLPNFAVFVVVVADLSFFVVFTVGRLLTNQVRFCICLSFSH